jgi:hypothetical protein
VCLPDSVAAIRRRETGRPGGAGLVVERSQHLVRGGWPICWIWLDRAEQAAWLALTHLWLGPYNANSAHALLQLAHPAPRIADIRGFKRNASRIEATIHNKSARNAAHGVARPSRRAERRRS